MIWVVIVFAAVLFLYWAMPDGEKRALFLSLVSAAVVFMVNPAYAIYYTVIAGGVYLCGAIIRKRERTVSKAVLVSSVSFLVLNLCFFKLFSSSFSVLDGVMPLSAVDRAGRGDILFPIGLSFLSFRAVHYLVESYRRQIREHSFARCFVYLLFFPTFLAGPVERFPRFDSQTLVMSGPDIRSVNNGLWRIVSGIFKKFILADMLFGYVMPVLASPYDHPRYVVLGAVYATAIWLYLDFGGYTDIAIGISKLFGYTIMENFDRPFMKESIALYWRSWHISVYSWIRDYFYLPFFVYKGNRAKMYCGIFLTMMVFMLWHAPTVNFFIAGVYNGIGLVVWQMFQEMKDRFPGLRDVLSLKWLRPISIFATFTYVSFGIGMAFGGTGINYLAQVAGRIFGF